MFRRPRHARDEGISPFRAGVIALVLVVAATYFGWFKANPFADPYELSAVFNDAPNLRPRSPVRIAGVNVGEVTGVDPVGGAGSRAARVTMKVRDEGLPIHRDAELKIRPRIFLEGNFFVDVQPGSPSAGELPDGGVIPANQTATPVQTGDVLAALQSDTRTDLQVLLRELAAGLAGEGAEGLSDSIPFWEPAYRGSALANEAALGTRRHDLSRLVRGQQRTFRALARNDRALRNLVTDFNVAAAAFAREDEALEQAIPALDDVLRVGTPALRSLDGSLPALRAFARDALPGVRSSEPTIDAALPFVRQARRLVADDELGGLAAELRPTVPVLVALNEGAVPLLEEQRALSACQNNVLVPFSNAPIPDPDFPANSGQPFYKQNARALVGLSGESRSFDANGPYYHVVGAGGPASIVSTGDDGQRLVGTTLFPILGVRPYKSVRPRFRPDVPCETQEPPNVEAPTGQVDEVVRPNPGAASWVGLVEREYGRVAEHMRLRARGVESIDPLRFDARGERIQARRRGYERNRRGVYAEARR